MIYKFFRDERTLMVLVFMGYVLKESFIVYDDEYRHPFPFYRSFEIHEQSWIMMAWMYGLFVILSFCIDKPIIKTKLFFNAVFIISFLEFVEYWLTYNHRWFEISVPINITVIRFIVLFLIMAYTLVTWRRT